MSSDLLSHAEFGFMCCALQQPYLVVQESDVEFWADYSDTETSSDAELGDAVSDIQLDSCSGGQLFGGILFTVGDRCDRVTWSIYHTFLHV